MKKFFNLLAAMLAVFLLGFGVVACASSNRISYKTDTGAAVNTISVTDDTWIMSHTIYGTTINLFKGTLEILEGDLTNGKAKLLQTHKATDKGWEESTIPYGFNGGKEITITDGKFDLSSQKYIKQ